MIDVAAALEVVSAWLPDFIAYHENPHHVDAPKLYLRACATVASSFADTYGDDPDVDQGEVLVAQETTITLLSAFAEWLQMRDQEPGGSGR